MGEHSHKLWGSLRVTSREKRGTYVGKGAEASQVSRRAFQRECAVQNLRHCCIDRGNLHQSPFKLNNMERLAHDANKLFNFTHFNEVPTAAATHMAKGGGWGGSGGLVASALNLKRATASGNRLSSCSVRF